MHLGDLINSFRKQQRLSMDEFADRSGLSKAYISMLERNENSRSKKPITPSLETIKAVSDVIGMDINDVLVMLDEDTEVSIQPQMTIKPDDKFIYLTEVYHRLNNDGREIVITTAEGLDKSGQYRANRSVDMSDYVETYSVASAAAGAGAYNEGHEEFYRRVSACDIPERFDAQIDITGDSMEPTIPDGAVAFVEFTLGDPPKDGEIYVFQRGEDTMIKRGFFEKDHWTLCSDNPEHEDITVTETDSVRIIGRLVDWTLPV